jgi:hypothetical protein
MRLLCRETGIGHQQIIATIKQAVEMGLIAITPGNAKRSTTYVLRLPAKSKGVPAVGTLRTHSRDRTVHEQSKNYPQCPDCGRYHDPAIPVPGTHCLHCHRKRKDLHNNLCFTCRRKSDSRWFRSTAR